jgi:RNA polymerase sigma-70 factor (ECF subfamily)
LYSPTLREYIGSLTAGHLLPAEPLVHETILRAARHLERASGQDLNSIRPWLFTLARRLVIDAMRARKAETTEMIDASPAIAALNPVDRCALIHVYIKGQPVNEAAAALGLPTETVKLRVLHALRVLRTALP